MTKRLRKKPHAAECWKHPKKRPAMRRRRRRLALIGTRARFDRMCEFALASLGAHVTQAMGVALSQGHRDLAVVFHFSDTASRGTSEKHVDMSVAVMTLPNALDMARAIDRDRPLTEEAERARRSPGAVPAIFLYRKLSKTKTLLSPLAFTSGGSA